MKDIRILGWTIQTIQMQLNELYMINHIHDINDHTSGYFCMLHLWSHDSLLLIKAKDLSERVDGDQMGSDARCRMAGSPECDP